MEAARKYPGLVELLREGAKKENRMGYVTAGAKIEGWGRC
jgi:hypothetical protein